jgi:hypothetical protein
LCLDSTFQILSSSRIGNVGNLKFIKEAHIQKMKL